MDDGRKDNAGGEIRRREDADGRFIVAGDNGPLDLQRMLCHDILIVTGVRSCNELVFNGAQMSKGGRRKVARQEVREGVLMKASCKLHGLCNEFPGLDDTSLGLTVGAFALDRLFDRRDGLKVHPETLERHFAIRHVQHEAT